MLANEEMLLEIVETDHHEDKLTKLNELIVRYNILNNKLDSVIERYKNRKRVASE